MIYLDDSATTKIDSRVLESMMPYFTEFYGNSSSTHSFGQKSRFAIDQARYTIADYLECTPQEIIFLSSGSESISLAIKGTAEYLATKSDKYNPENVYIVTTPLEHSSVMKTISHLAFFGYKNKVLSVDTTGNINLEDFKQVLENIKNENPNASILITVQYVNSETGVIQDIPQISKIAHEYDAIVHTDAMQAAKLLNISVKDLSIDLMTFAAHKINGPVGAAALYLKSGSKISRQIDGGAQEYNIRAGTHNTPAIVGFGKTIELLKEERELRKSQIYKLSDLFLENLSTKIPDIKLIGGNSDELRMKSICAFIFPNTLATEFLVRLDMAGIMASAGSACNSGSIQPTENLKSIGLTDQDLNSVIRFSIGKDIKEDEITQACEIISHEYNTYIQSKTNSRGFIKNS